MRLYRIILLFIGFIISEVAFTQERWNLDFTGVEKNKTNMGWKFTITANDQPYYSFTVDSSDVVNKKNSVCIKSQAIIPTGNSAYCFYSVPLKQVGNKIELKAYLKTDQVLARGSGLWLRVRGPKTLFQDGNVNAGMYKIDIAGDKNWKEYSLELPIGKEDKEIQFGGVLRGPGKLWFSDFRLFIDGRPLEEAKMRKPKNIKNPVDTMFLSTSNINITKVAGKQIKDLSLLAKVWGFLKYHHPKVALDSYNWDFELFKIIPKILICKNEIDRDEILLNWIEGLGRVDSCKVCALKNEGPYKIEPDFSWLDRRKLMPALVSKLQFIYDNRLKREQKPRSLNNAENPDFKNEELFYKMSFPDAGYRMLALFRFWNMIEYEYPYKYGNILNDWGTVLNEFIPKFVSTPDTISYRLTLSELVSQIHDSHLSIDFYDLYWYRYKGIYHVPVEVVFVGRQAVVAGYLGDEKILRTGLFPGDIITEINGRKTNEIIRGKLKITSGSNEAYQLRMIAPHLLAGNSPDEEIRILRNGSSMKISLKRRMMWVGTGRSSWLPPYDSCYKLLSKEVGYINLSKLNINRLPEIFEKFKNTKGILIDNRYGIFQSFAYNSLGAYLLPDSTIFVKLNKMDINNPGYLQSESIKEKVGSVNLDYYKGKVGILVNSITMSNAEFTTMALRRAPKSAVIGSQTAGADGNVSMFVLPGNFSSFISGVGVYYPDGKETQRVGIVPDIEVKLTVKGIKEGRDEVLEKAIEWINH